MSEQNEMQQAIARSLKRLGDLKKEHGEERGVLMFLTGMSAEEIEEVSGE